MTEHNPEPTDLQAQFHLDQDAARNEQQTRDDWAWEHQVRTAEAHAQAVLEDVAIKSAGARRIRAQASLLETLDALLWVAIVLGIIWAGWYGIASLIGALR